MNCSTPGLPVHHQLPEFTQVHIHRVSDAIQPSHPLSSPSPPAPNPSQHHGLLQWVNSSHEVAKVWSFSFSIIPSKEHKKNKIFFLRILQARKLKWVAFSFRGSSQPRSPTLQVDSLSAEPQGKPKNTGGGRLSLLQQIFPTQESNQGLLHCRQILYQLSYQGIPIRINKRT